MARDILRLAYRRQNFANVDRDSMPAFLATYDKVHRVNIELHVSVSAIRLSQHKDTTKG